MAISYSLGTATPRAALDVAHLLYDAAKAVGVFDVSTRPDELLAGVGTALGTWIRVMVENPQPWNPVVEDLGFTPTVSVTFRLGKEHGATPQQDDMIRLVSGLLPWVPGDTVLHLHYEDIWLLRRKGELILSDRDDMWSARRLAMIQIPYRRAPIDFGE